MQWRTVQFIGHEGLAFVTSVILARLLLPEKFGLVAMLAIFMAVSTVFAESGFGTALIQRKNPSRTDCNTIFYFNILVGALATTCIYLAAP